MAGLPQLAPFETTLEDLSTARDKIYNIGGYRSTGDERSDQRNAWDYEDAEAAEQAVVTRLVEGVNAADESVISEPQKAMILKVLTNQYRRRLSIDESKEEISAGFAVFDRVAANLDEYRGTVANIGEKSLSLFKLQGADDITISDFPSRGNGVHQSMDLSLSGFKVKYEDAEISRDNIRVPIMETQSSQRIVDEMGRLDPASNRYRLPFIPVLGREHDDGRDITELIGDDDKRRYASRLLIASLSRQAWLRVSPPQPSYSEGMAKDFAGVYADLLSGVTPRDKVMRRKPNFRGEYVAHTPQFGRGDISNEQLKLRLHAANITIADVKEATKEALAVKSRGKTAADIVATLRSRDLIEPFFEQLEA